MTTRAEDILYAIGEVIDAPFVYGGISALAAGAHIARSVWQAKHNTREKLQQAGFGAEHQQAKSDLGKLRRQRYGIHTPAHSLELKQKYLAQKAKVRDVENRGLQHYHATLAQNPIHQAAVRHHELVARPE